MELVDKSSGPGSSAFAPISFIAEMSFRGHARLHPYGFSVRVEKSYSGGGAGTGAGGGPLEEGGTAGGTAGGETEWYPVSRLFTLSELLPLPVLGVDGLVIATCSGRAGLP